MQQHAKNKSAMKPKWGKQTPKLFTYEEELAIANTMNELRMLELKMVHLQADLVSDITSAIKWVTAKGYVTWGLTSPKNKAITLVGRDYISKLQADESLTLNMFSGNKNNNVLSIVPFDDKHVRLVNSRSAKWLNTLLTRGFYPNDLPEVIFNLYVKGKHNVAYKSTQFEVAFESARRLAKQSLTQQNTEFEDWKLTVPTPGIELLRSLSSENRKLKNSHKLNKAA